MRKSERGDSVTQIENSTVQENVIEASLISYAGGRGGDRGKSRSRFSVARPGTDFTPPAAVILARSSEPQSFSIP